MVCIELVNVTTTLCFQVLDHKTVRKYGLAQLYLNAEEYGWCKRWLRVRARTIQPNHFFFTSFGRGEAKDMVRYVRKAWAEMGLSGVPSLMDIRTAVATYVSLSSLYAHFFQMAVFLKLINMYYIFYRTMSKTLTQKCAQ